jgi:hypothetical protein
MGERLQASNYRIDVGIPVHVRVHHAANFEHLDLGRTHFSGSRHRSDEFLRTLGIRPIEHLDAIGKGLLDGGNRATGGSHS